MVICPRCGYTWYTWSKKPYLRCNACGASVNNPIHEIAVDYEKHKNKSLEAEIYKIIMNEPLISPAQLVRKGVMSKSLYKRLRKMEKEGKINLLHAGRRILIPLSELSKIITPSVLYIKQLEQEKKKQKEAIQGPGVQLPAP